MTQNPPAVFPSRIAHEGLRQKIMSADAAAALIHHGDHVGMSGFTGAATQSSFPWRWRSTSSSSTTPGRNFASACGPAPRTAPELDGALAKVGGMDMRLP